jgi:amino acid transporter
MPLLDRVLGRPLSTDEAEEQQIGPAAGIPVLGLDALSSAAYGPEAALTLLLPLGAAGLHFVAPIIGLIVAILLIVYFSYRQTIEAYPGGGGSYTVARENLGPRYALLAGAALALDYVLNVAVGISAGVGALVSAMPALLPHTTALCLAILVLLTLVNLRGVRESGLVFMVPTYVCRHARDCHARGPDEVGSERRTSRARRRAAGAAARG